MTNDTFFLNNGFYVMILSILSLEKIANGSLSVTCRQRGLDGIAKSSAVRQYNQKFSFTSRNFREGGSLM